MSKLEFGSIDRIVYCVRIDRTKIIQSILDNRRVSSGKGKILRAYNYIVIQEIKKIIDGFC